MKLSIKKFSSIFEELIIKILSPIYTNLGTNLIAPTVLSRAMISGVLWRCIALRDFTDQASPSAPVTRPRRRWSCTGLPSCEPSPGCATCSFLGAYASSFFWRPTLHMHYSYSLLLVWFSSLALWWTKFIGRPGIWDTTTRMLSIPGMLSDGVVHCGKNAFDASVLAQKERKFSPS